MIQRMLAPVRAGVRVLRGLLWSSRRVRLSVARGNRASEKTKDIQPPCIPRSRPKIVCSLIWRSTRADFGCASYEATDFSMAEEGSIPVRR